MEVEGFIYPLLFLACAAASALLAWLLRVAIGARFGVLQLLSVVLLGPLVVLFLAAQDQDVDWSYAGYSVGVAGLGSFSVTVFQFLSGSRQK